MMMMTPPPSQRPSSSSSSSVSAAGRGGSSSSSSMRAPTTNLHKDIAKLSLSSSPSSSAKQQQQQQQKEAENEGGELSGLPPPYPTISSFSPHPRISSSSSTSVDLNHLPREVLLTCFSFLRSWDLMSLVLTSKSAVDHAVVEERAVDHAVVEEATNGLMTTYFGGIPPGASGRGVGAMLEGLRFQEIQNLHKLLSVPEPDRGYWVSKQWLSNHRRFAENQAARRKSMLLSLSSSGGSGGSGGSKRRNSRERRESETMPPWSDVNADITCQHGGLRPQSKPGGGGGSPAMMTSSSSSSSSSLAPMARRKIIDKKAWKVLRRYYDEGKAFKTSTAEECLECSAKDREEKEKLEEERKVRDQELASSPLLERLYHRRTGSPSAFGLAPLDPGLYHVVPRNWLTSWRNYIRDPRVSRPRPPDCCLLLCEAHGLPLIPPHVAEFLQGERKGVLSALNGRSGIICEILCMEEWEEVTKIYPTDFCLKFSVDPEDLSITWSTNPCHRCDPCSEDAPVTVRNRQRKWSI